MKPVTPAFAQAIQADHQAITQVDVLINNTVAHTFTNDTPITAGAVQLDAGAATRGRLEGLTITDPTGDLIPRDAMDMLAPYGTELQPRRGIVLPDGTTELVNLGIYRVDNPTVTDDGKGGRTITISGPDRSARVIDARLESILEIPAGTNTITAIQELLEYVDASLILTGTTTTDATTTASTFEPQTDRWQIASDLATSAGLRLYFNENGQPRLQPETVAATPDLELVEGGPNLLAVTREWSRDGIYNAVIATGENNGMAAPVTGRWEDDDPDSPTYYHGPFGKTPRFYASPLLATTEQATDAARTLGARSQGATETVQFTSLVNPAVEPGTTVQITREAAGINSLNVIDQITIPLTAGQPASGRTRATRTVTL